jgi:hypothetical protein
MARCPYTQEQLKRAFKAGKAAGFDEVRVEMIEPDTGRKWVAIAAKSSLAPSSTNPWDEVSK